MVVNQVSLKKRPTRGFFLIFGCRFIVSHNESYGQLNVLESVCNLSLPGRE